MPRLYITKWVLARGILVTNAKLEKPPTPRGYKPRAWICLPGQRFKIPLLLGSEVFLSLDEAKEDARRRFEAALKQSQASVAYLTRAVEGFDSLQIHEEIERVNLCRAFPGGPEFISDPDGS